MVFGRTVGGWSVRMPQIPFQFPVGIRWCSDKNDGFEKHDNWRTFNSLWELDGVRTYISASLTGCRLSAFNSLWELDGVRTGLRRGTRNFPVIFQFPVGIRWCSDYCPFLWISGLEYPFNSLWELDGVRTAWYALKSMQRKDTFNSLWELDGVRTRKEVLTWKS